MAIVTKKCYDSNISKAIYFYFYSRNVCSVIEATAQIDRYLKMLKSKMKNTDFVLCFIYTGYFYYLRKLINIAWTRQFVGWCDLYTVMSEKLHKRNLGKKSYT